jgi:alpha-ketoglutarate-dependent 2,4-dichlorophenoxyacetate dioxygenase
MSVHVEPVSENFVATVSGVDLTASLSDGEVSEIVAAIDRYAVLVFHDQPVTQEQQVAFASSLGPLDYGPTKALATIQTRLKEQALSDISNVDISGKVAARTHAQSVMNIGNMQWHSDASYQHYPFRYSILTCQVPAKWGGQTEFADLRAAYDALDPHLREIIENKTGEFFSVHGRDLLGVESPDALRAMFPPVHWPLVRTHPATGRKILWVGTPLRAIDGMPTHEARMLANILLEHASREERVHAHQWRTGDLVMWDNRSVLHRGRWFDLDERRELRRAGTSDDVGSLDAPAEAKPEYRRMAIV